MHNSECKMEEDEVFLKISKIGCSIRLCML